MEEISKVRVDVGSAQEICWKGQGRMDKQDFSLFYSGPREPRERTGRYGTGFIINAQIRKKPSFFQAS
jgi:hypothetical protein